jgi:hypothetical protein
VVKLEEEESAEGRDQDSTYHLMSSPVLKTHPKADSGGDSGRKQEQDSYHVFTPEKRQVLGNVDAKDLILESRKQSRYVPVEHRLIQKSQEYTQKLESIRNNLISQQMNEVKPIPE